MIVHLSRDAEFLNRVVNDPSVFPYVSLGIEGPLDVTPLVEDLSNMFFANEHGGFLLVHKGADVYEIHTQFLPTGRGHQVRQAAQEAMEYMFKYTNCEALMSYVPVENRSAAFLARGVGMQKCGKVYPLGRECDLYLIRKGEWLCQSQAQ